jgi:hypothetical protein
MLKNIFLGRKPLSICNTTADQTRKKREHGRTKLWRLDSLGRSQVSATYFKKHDSRVRTQERLARFAVYRGSSHSRDYFPYKNLCEERTITYLY